MALSLTPRSAPSAPSVARPSLPAWPAPSCDHDRRRWSPWHRRARGPSALLAGVAPFDRYPEPVVGQLSRHADQLRLRRGTVIAQGGRRAREVVVVVSGRVDTLVADTDDAAPTGDAPAAARPARSFGPGSWIGTRELLAAQPHAHTLVAAEGTEVVVLNGPAYRWAAGNLPGLVDDTA